MRPAHLPDPDLLKAVNINLTTGLAGDYLNHYNAIALMIATRGDIPEMREPVLERRPVGYATHLRMTGFRDRDLAVDVYESAPSQVKARFFAARRKVDLAILDVQDLMEAGPEASARAPEIFAAIARLGCVTKGGEARASGMQSDLGFAVPLTPQRAYLCISRKGDRAWSKFPGSRLVSRVRTRRRAVGMSRMLKASPKPK